MCLLTVLLLGVRKDPCILQVSTAITCYPLLLVNVNSLCTEHLCLSDCGKHFGDEMGVKRMERNGE